MISKRAQWIPRGLALVQDEVLTMVRVAKILLQKGIEVAEALFFFIEYA